MSRIEQDTEEAGFDDGCARIGNVCIGVNDVSRANQQDLLEVIDKVRVRRLRRQYSSQLVHATQVRLAVTHCMDVHPQGQLDSRDF